MPIKVALKNLEEICEMHSNQSLFLNMWQEMIDSLTEDMYRINLYKKCDIILMPHCAIIYEN